MKPILAKRESVETAETAVGKGYGKSYPVLNPLGTAQSGELIHNTKKRTRQ